MKTDAALAAFNPLSPAPAAIGSRLTPNGYATHPWDGVPKETVRIKSPSMIRARRSIRGRLLVCTYDAPTWGVRVDKPTESRNSPAPGVDCTAPPEGAVLGEGAVGRLRRRRLRAQVRAHRPGGGRVRTGACGLGRADVWPRLRLCLHDARMVSTHAPLAFALAFALAFRARARVRVCRAGNGVLTRHQHAIMRSCDHAIMRSPVCAGTCTTGTVLSWWRTGQRRACGSTTAGR